MSIFNITDHIEKLTDTIKTYIDSSAEYYKLDLFKKIMKGAVSLVNLLVIGSIFLIFILFISVAVAILIGNSLDNLSSGYFIVGGFYLLLFIFVFAFGRDIIAKAMLTKFSKIFFNEPTQEDVLDDDLKELSE